jgi:hypothetical protein
MSNQTFWVVGPCSSVTSFRHFGGKKYRFHIQDDQWIHGLITLKMKAVRSFETSGLNYPSTRRNSPKDTLSHTKTDLRLILRYCHLQWVTRQASRMTCPYLSLQPSFPLSLARQATRRLVVVWAACLREEWGSLNGRCWEQHCLLFLYLSLSPPLTLTHTHTHTH